MRIPCAWIADNQEFTVFWGFKRVCEQEFRKHCSKSGIFIITTIYLTSVRPKRKCTHTTILVCSLFLPLDSQFMNANF
jgi:hypothetical protein